MNNNHSLNSKAAIYWAILLLFLPFQAVAAPTLNRILKEVPIGSDTNELIRRAGMPREIEKVERWIYPGNHELVIQSGEVIDVRLNPALLDKRISFRKDAATSRTENTIRFARIGMDASEALEIVGKPELIEQGEDWYYSKRQRVEISEGRVRAVQLHLKATLESIDWIRLNFSPTGLFIMNVTIAFIMFGVALGIKLSHFKLVVQKPKSVVIGFISQFVLLPLLTFILILIIRPTPSVAMGMILVAACPGGNISNFMTSIAKGNVALSISLTAIATASAIFMTPLNFAFWGSLYTETANMVIPISINPIEMLKTVVILLGIPVVLGVLFSDQFPETTNKIMKPMRYISMTLFLGFVVAAFSSNFSYFLQYIHLIFLIVLAHNAMALLIGFGISTFFKLPRKDRRTLTIETGIQNSGLGLVLIFNPNLFDGLGGMAFIAAWWGIWHIVSGLAMSFFWSKRSLPEDMLIIENKS